MARLRRVAATTTPLRLVKGRPRDLDPDAPEPQKYTASPDQARYHSMRETERPKTCFLVQPHGKVWVDEPLQPFVVMARRIPAETLGPGMPPYRAKLTIWFNNSSTRILDPYPLVEHQEHWIQPSSEKAATRTILFVFRNVKIRYPGDYTFVVSIFGPGEDGNGTPMLTTPTSIVVGVVAKGSIDLELPGKWS